MIHKNYNLKKFIIPLTGGILYTLGYPGLLTTYQLNHFSFSILGLSLIFYGFKPRENSINKNEIYSLLFLIYSIHFLGFSWIAHTIKEFGEIYPPFNYILFIFSSVAISPHLFIFLIFYHLCKKFLGHRELFQRNESFFIATLFTACEILTPQQFPASVGHSYMSMAPHLGLAPIFGNTIYSFFSILLAFSLSRYYQEKKLKFDLIFSLLTFSIFITLNLLIPLPYDRGEKLGPLKVRIIQANIGNYLKYSSEEGDLNSIGEVSQRYQDLSLKNSDDQTFDLLVWPETAYPFYLYPGNAPSPMGHQALFNILKQTQKHLFFGGYSYKEKSWNAPFEQNERFEDVYNTAFLINPEGKIEKRYYKQKLLPFGETLPFGPLTPLLAKFITNISYFAKGDQFTLFEIKEIPFISLICYELLLPDFVRTFLNSVEKVPQFIINLTNDSWFGQSMEPYQHLFLGKWRAIEFQIPIIRSTNTGITSLIYPDGHESRQLSLGESASLDVELSLKKREHTLYQKLGILPFILFLLFFISIRELIARKVPLESDREDE